MSLRGRSLSTRPLERVTGALPPAAYSHSIVAGGFDVTSRTRLTAGISFTICDETLSITSCGNFVQPPVIASSLVTARITTG